MNSGHEASGPGPGGTGNGVLARIIQRRREPQSSLAPVIQPRFAPRADGFAPGDEAAPNALPSAAFRPEALPSGAFPAEARSPGAFRPEARSPGAFPAEALSPDAPAPEAQSPDVLLPAAPGVVRSGPPEASRTTASGSRFPQLIPWLVTATVGSAAEDGSASGGELVPLDPGPPSRGAPAASDWTGTSRAASREYHSEQRSYRSAAVPAGEPGHEAGARESSVTITIGHIEVRAAPAPPRPPRPEAPPRPKPAFRPRTTLADFLDGGGRPGGSGRR
jgi:hypothetical protein